MEPIEEARGGAGRRGAVGRLSLPADALAHNTGFLMSKVSQLSREEFERALAPLGLTARYYGVLTTLVHREKPCTQRGLGEALAIDRSTMVGLIDELEEAGLVGRRRHPEDRRRYEVALTHLGKETVSAAESVATRTQERVLAPLEEDQRRQLHEMLTSVLHNLDRGDSGGPG